MDKTIPGIPNTTFKKNYMYTKPFFTFLLLFSIACNNNASSYKQKTISGAVVAKASDKENPYKHIGDIPLPDGFSRVITQPDSFGSWLRYLELKKNKTVYLFDGRPKTNQAAQFAVIDMPVGNKDLQQCADAVMRLRAQYLFDNSRFSEIDFRDNENKDYHFTQPYTKENFNRFMEQVFGMCGSASLSKQLKPTSFDEIKSGDVLIRGGFPGHAVTVIDVARNSDGKKIYLLAQSYMPAQDIHILRNPNDENLSPWYEVNDDNDILTPEYLFHNNELKKW